MPDWLTRLNQLVSDTTGSIRDSVARYVNSSPLDEVVYPTVEKATTPGSQFRMLSDPVANDNLKYRLSRIKEPDVKTRVLFETLGAYGRNDPTALKAQDSVRTLLENNGLDKWSGNKRAFMQALTGGFGGYGDTLGFGKSRVSMPTESGESPIGSIFANAPGAMLGSILPMMAGGLAADASIAKGALPEAANLWQAIKQLGPRAARTIFRAEGESKLPFVKAFPTALRNQALAWGGRDASSALNSDWEAGRLAEGMNTAFGDMPGVEQLHDPREKYVERGIHALGQGVLGGLGFIAQPLLTRAMGFNEAQSTLRQLILRGEAGLGSGIPQAVIGAPAQSWHQSRDLDWDTMAKLAGVQMFTGGLFGAALPADLPNQYGPRVNAKAIATPGFNDIETRPEVPGRIGANNVPSSMVDAPNFPEDTALAVQMALMDEAARMDPQRFAQALAEAQKHTQNAYVYAPEKGGVIRYTGKMDLPGGDIMKDQRLVMTAQGPQRVLNEDLLKLHRLLQPSVPGLSEQLLTVPPGYEFLPGVERSGRPWPVHLQDEAGNVTEGAHALATNQAGKTWSYDPATQQYVELGTNRVRLPKIDRSLMSHLGILDQKWRESQEKRVTNQQTPLRTRVPDDWKTISSDLDANPNLKAILEERMRAREAAAPPVEVDPLGDIDPFETAPPIARGPARGGRLRQGPFE